MKTRNQHKYTVGQRKFNFQQQIRTLRPPRPGTAVKPDEQPKDVGEGIAHEAGAVGMADVSAVPFSKKVWFSTSNEAVGWRKLLERYAARRPQCHFFDRRASPLCKCGPLGL